MKISNIFKNKESIALINRIIQTKFFSSKNPLPINLVNHKAPFLEEKLLDEGKFKSKDAYNNAFTEFKKYSYLTTLTDSQLGMTSKNVDEVWHQYILFTKKYEEYCDEFLGHYLHHTPKTSFTPLHENSSGNFIKMYLETYGNLPEVWETSGWCESGGCSTGRCGTCIGNCGNDCSSYITK